MCRNNPAVIEQASKLFVHIAQALAAETLVGQTATRVATSTKNMLTAAKVDPVPLLQQFPQASQEIIMRYFN